MSDGGTRIPLAVRRVAVFLAVTVFLVTLTWMCVIAAGSWWSILVALFAIAVAFAADRVDQRPSKLTPLQRFEEREQRRAA